MKALFVYISHNLFVILNVLNKGVQELKSLKNISLLLLFFIATGNIFSNHWMGGEITWMCDGTGNYIFTLKIHRDCSGPPAPLVGQNIRVWGHPSVSTIAVSHLITNEVSPVCKQVPGGPTPISCTSNPVIGAAQEYVYTSAPITLAGTPPAQGWVFTWDNLTRNPSITNLVNPSTKGITLRAIMYANGANNANPCFDSSPQFIESPSSIICAGNSFTYSPNAFDPDFDSLVFSFGQPLDRIITSYNPPADPAILNYTTGYNVNSPLPSTTQNASNIPASINPETGEISFQSSTLGSFAIVVRVQSYRCNVLIAEVYREMQVIIVNCSPNNPPVAIPPLNTNTTYSDTVVVGTIVNFDFEASDFDKLQDGTDQTVEITATGSQFGTNYIDANTGCENPPCATLSFTPPISGAPTATTNFQWQTTCDHLAGNNSFGCGQSSTYKFVFKVKDDFCPAPATKYHTVSITVVPSSSLPPPKINCVSVLASGAIRITWESINDPDNSFQEYEIYGRTGANPFSLIASLPNVFANGFLHFGANGQTDKWEYIIGTKSACGIVNFADTVSSILLNINNPNNGEAILQWNPVFSPTNSSSSSGWYKIFREYPKGTFTFIDSVPYGNEYYRDTITVCDDSVWYRVSIDDLGCSSLSNVKGDRFEDKLAPKPPVIRHVTVDTAGGFTRICWYPTTPNDAEGYIVLKQIGSNWVPQDTIFATDSFCYNDHSSTPNFNPECYGIAAHDTCWSGVPLNPNTSAMGTPHCSMYLTEQYNVCNKSINLNWTPYEDWDSGVGNYKVYSVINGVTILEGVTNGSTTNFAVNNVLPNTNYCFVILAVSDNAKDTALSNKVCVNTYYPAISDTNYLQVATVQNNSQIELKIYSETNASISGYQIERSTDGVSYNVIGFAPYLPPITSFIDNGVSANETFYFYRAIALDSCGAISDSTSNIAKTILLTVSANSNAFTNILNWDTYYNWDGTTNSYEVYRKIGSLPYTSIATVPLGTQTYTDDVGDFYNQDTEGSFCYKIKAIENVNSYGFAEESFSNNACTTIDYLLYVPNAFTVNGFNPIFKPVIGFANFDSYSLTIYNRIYKEVFTTTNVDEGWDGTYKGKPLQEGVYVYFIQFNDSKGQPFQKIGHVTLLKN